MDDYANAWAAAALGRARVESEQSQTSVPGGSGRRDAPWGRWWATRRPATASGARASRLQPRRRCRPRPPDQERARKEWLQYHLQTANWAAAEELVVSVDEREDLAYLTERERRLGLDSRGAAYDEPTNSHLHEDYYGGDNEAAEAAAKQGTGGSRHAGPPARVADDDDDDML